MLLTGERYDGTTEVWSDVRPLSYALRDIYLYRPMVRYASLDGERVYDRLLYAEEDMADGTDLWKTLGSRQILTMEDDGEREEVEVSTVVGVPLMQVGPLRDWLTDHPTPDLSFGVFPAGRLHHMGWTGTLYGREDLEEGELFCTRFLVAVLTAAAETLRGGGPVTSGGAHTFSLLRSVAERRYGVPARELPSL